VYEIPEGNSSLQINVKSLRKEFYPDVVFVTIRGKEYKEVDLH
jgi:hypothetical protein